MRLTLDIDNKKELNRVIEKITDIFKRRIIDEIYISSSGRGYHVIIRNLNLDFAQIQILRYMLNDDRKRVYIDYIRDKQHDATQVLFTEKNGKKAIKVFDREKKINRLPKYLRFKV